MTVNIRLRKGSKTVITESLCQGTLDRLEDSEDVNIDVYPGAIVAVLEDGATAEEIAMVLKEGGVE